MFNTPTYNSWRAMRQRCTGISPKDNKYYYDKGITFEPRWECFLNFLEDMGERPEGMTLDRIDGTKDYSKDNCKWSTAIQQVTNRKSWSKLGEKYIVKRRYGFRVKITGIINKTVQTLSEAIELRDKYFKIKLTEINYGKES